MPKTIKKRMTFMEVIKEFRKNGLLYIMMLPALAWVAIFSYGPLYGIQLAFKRFDFRLGIWDSPWVGLANFEFLFTYRNTPRIFFNTIYLNILFLIAGTIMSVFLALMFMEIKNRMYRRITQSIVILPHFISWAVVSMFLVAFIGSQGLINQFIISIGGERIRFYANPDPWPAILVILRIWIGAGFGTIVYIAAITGIDPQLYEAATVDGATRLQQIRLITLPLLKTTVILLTLLGIGGIFRGDFGMIYAIVMDNAQLFPTTDVIDTFVFRALRQMNELGMSTATSFFQSVVGFIFVYATNAIARKAAPDSAIF